MSYNTIKYEISDGILLITLDRPDKLNAFTTEMATELIHAFGAASVDDKVHAIIVTGNGRAFCAGMDLSGEGNVFGLNESLKPSLQELRERMHEPEMAEGVRDTGGKLTLAIYRCDKPVIAALNGAAVGIGATMTCAMDFRLASDQARVGFVFNRIGITPEACSTWFLPRIVGLATALDWMLTGEILGAADILQRGFVRAVLPPEKLLPEAFGLARRLARHSPVTLALTRQMLYRNSVLSDPAEAHLIESLAVHYTSQVSGKEGVNAFLDKREAVFRDRISTDMPAFYPWWDDND